MLQLANCGGVVRSFDAEARELAEAAAKATEKEVEKEVEAALNRVIKQVILAPHYLARSELSRALSEGALTGAAFVQAKQKVGGRPSKVPVELQLTDEEKVALCRHGRANGWYSPAKVGWGDAMLSLGIDSKKRKKVTSFMRNKNPTEIQKKAVARAAKKPKPGTAVASPRRSA